jgi:hypothetical protein
MAKGFDSRDTLVRGPETIKRWTKLLVEAGTAAVITQDGAYRSTHWPGGNAVPGGHWFVGHMPFSKLQVYRVDTRDRTLKVGGDFLLQYPAHIPTEMEVTVFYKVVNPQIVALEIADPLSHLRQWTVEAIRHSINRLGDEEYLRGEDASHDILNYLKGQGVEDQLGIQVYDVQISQLDAQQEIQTRLGLRELQLLTAAEANIAQTVSHNPAHLAIKYPELYTNLLEVVKSLAINNFDPQALPNPEQAEQLMSLLSAFTPGQSQASPNIAGYRHRMQAECAALRRLGFDVTLKEDTNGDCYAAVRRQDAGRPPLQMYLVCGSTYPQTAPQAYVEVAGEQRDFTSAVIEGWTPECSLEDVVAEAVDFFSFALEGGSNQ